MTDLDLSQFDGADAQKFAILVKAASKDQLEAVLAGEHRGHFLDAIFHRMPDQFRADRAGATSAVIHWSITGRPGGGADAYEVVIADGACTVNSAPQAEPKLTFTLGGYDFLQLIAGIANPMMMFMTGKVKAKGDLSLAANVGNLFDLPKA